MGGREMPEETESREERADSQAKRSLDRAMEVCGVEDPEDFLDLLEDDPHSREAAAGAFWYTQVVQQTVATFTVALSDLEDDPKLTSEEAAKIRAWCEGHLEKPHQFKGKLMEYLFPQAMATDSESHRGDRFGGARALAKQDPHVAMLLATGLLTLLVSEAVGQAGPLGRVYYTEDIRDTLEVARQCAELMTDRKWLHGHGIEVYEDEWIHTDDGLVFKSWLGDVYSACGIYLAEYGAFEASESRFEDAFLHLWNAAQRLSEEDDLVVPHLGDAFNHVERQPGETGGAGFSKGMEELMVVWENLQASSYRQKVRSWDQLAKACEDLAGFPYIDIDEGVIFRRSDPGEIVDVSEYWWKAYAFAVGQMSPSALTQEVIRIDRERHCERLQHDFFDDCWSALEQDTQGYLVNEEMLWYTARQKRGRKDSAVNELRKGFEGELRQMFIKPIERQIDDLLSDRERRESLGLHSRDAGSINLGDIAKLLEHVSAKSLDLLALHRLIEGAGLTVKDKRFIHEDLPRFVGRLWRARNEAEHEGRCDRGTMRTSRREALGIGCEGMLPRLARLKKRMMPGTEKARRLRSPRRGLPSGPKG